MEGIYRLTTVLMIIAWYVANWCLAAQLRDDKKMWPDDGLGKFEVLAGGLLVSLVTTFATFVVIATLTWIGNGFAK